MSDLEVAAPDAAPEHRTEPPALTDRSVLQRWAIRLGWVAVGAPFVLEAIAIARASQAWLIGRTSDDAFYYLEIARRIDHGQGFSFDGIHATNGFHPAWQLTLAGLGLVVPGQTALLKADLLVCLAMIFVSLLLVVRVVWRWLGPGPALAGAILAAHSRGAMNNFADGMEGALCVLALAVVLTALVWYFDDPSARRAVVVGALCGLVVLSRLDMVVVMWVVPAAMVLRVRAWRHVGGWLVGTAVVLPWAAWYWVRYHHVLTTSATVKQHQIAALVAADGGRFSRAWLDYVGDKAGGALRTVVELVWDSAWRDVTVLGVGLGLVLAGLAVVGLVSRLARRSELDRGDRSVGPPAWGVGAIAALLALKAAFDLYNSPTWAAGWYFTPQKVAVPFAVGSLAWMGATVLSTRSRKVGIAAVAVLCVFALPLNGAQVRQSADPAVDGSSWQGAIEQAAAWVQLHGPSGRYGASDAGLLGYRLDGVHPVVNLDGLVNNYRFAALMDRDASLLERIRATGVDVYVNRVTGAQLRSMPCARLLWHSPELVGGVPIDVLDVRGCR